MLLAAFLMLSQPAHAGDLPAGSARTLAGAIDDAFDAAYDGQLASSPILRCDGDQTCASAVPGFETYAKRCQTWLAPTTDALVMAMGRTPTGSVNERQLTLGGSARLDEVKGTFTIEWSCAGSLRQTVFTKFDDRWLLTKP